MAATVDVARGRIQVASGSIGDAGDEARGAQRTVAGIGAAQVDRVGGSSAQVDLELVDVAAVVDRTGAAGVADALRAGRRGVGAEVVAEVNRHSRQPVVAEVERRIAIGAKEVAAGVGRGVQVTKMSAAASGRPVPSVANWIGALAEPDPSAS